MALVFTTSHETPKENGINYNGSLVMNKLSLAPPVGLDKSDSESKPKSTEAIKKKMSNACNIIGMSNACNIIGIIKYFCKFDFGITILSRSNLSKIPRKKKLV